MTNLNPPLLGPPKLHRSSPNAAINRTISISTKPQQLPPITLNPLVRLFFNISPNATPSTLSNNLRAAWGHNPLKTVKFICSLASSQDNAKFQKEVFFSALVWLHHNHPITLACNLEAFMHSGCFKYFPELLYRIIKNKQETEDHDENYRSGAKPTEEKSQKPKEEVEQNKEAAKAQRKEKDIIRARRAMKLYISDGPYRFLHNRVAEIFANLLKSDLQFLKSGEIEKISLASKCCPSIDKFWDKRTLICESIARRIFPRESDAQYKDIEEAHYAYRVRDRLRKEVLVPLRKAIEATNKCKQILCKKPILSVTKKSLYLKALSGNNEEKKYKACQELVKKQGIPIKHLFPHQIVASLKDEVSGKQWQQLVEYLSNRENLKNCLAVCDTSERTNGVQLDLCIGMGLLISQLSDEPWKGMVLNYSNNPKLCRVEGDDLRSKVEFLRGLECAENMNFQQAFDQILNVAMAQNLSQDRMVKTIFVFGNVKLQQTSNIYWTVRRSFVNQGYETLPQIVFWNSYSNTLAWNRNNQTEMVDGISKHSLVKFFGGELNVKWEDLLRFIPRPDNMIESVISGAENQNFLVFD